MAMLDREEYVEQAYLFHQLSERMRENVAAQDLLKMIKEELLSTTRLPMAVDFLSAELRQTGIMSDGMARLAHYFSPFQTFVMREAESERAKFDIYVALEVLRKEAQYRATGPLPQGIFLFQFETICRNRLGYDKGLQAVGADTIFDNGWKDWLTTLRRQIGIVDFADLLYVRSEYYQEQRRKTQGSQVPPEKPVLFGVKEGKIAFANRRKDPLYLFAALGRQLGYPEVPRPKPPDESKYLLPNLLKRMERIEARLKLIEEETKEGTIDLPKLYGPQPPETM